jgi:predicted transcriptional regulator
MSKRTGRTGKYPFIARLTGSWKKRAKKSKILLKDLAKNANIAPQHLTKIINGDCQNPRLITINAVEMALVEAEAKVGGEK